MKRTAEVIEGSIVDYIMNEDEECTCPCIHCPLHTNEPLLDGEGGKQ